MKKFKFLIIDKDEQGVFSITLNNPKIKNALNPEMIKELKDILLILKVNSEARILSITGQGDVFCAGADLEWMKASRNLTQKENKKDALIFTELLEEINNFPKPTIALVNGHVFGGGLGLIAACDFVIANKDAKFCFSEVKLGIIPAMIAPYILRNIGYKQAKNLFLTGEVFNAEKALKIHLIDDCTERENLENIKNTLVNKLLIGSPNAQKEIKQFLAAINHKKINEDLINYSAEKIAAIRISTEAKEGIDSFLGKKKAKWII